MNDTGILYLISTPIGNLADMTLRAINTLRNVDYVYCEDTRVSRILLNHYQIEKKLISYHDFNATKIRPLIIRKLLDGFSCALISDAGTPLIADPGYKLVQECYANNIVVDVIPGASAILPALLLSGFASDEFLFLGFKDNYQKHKNFTGSIILFASPHKILKTLEKLHIIWPQRAIALVREITKKYQEVIKAANPAELIEKIKVFKGEMVIVLSAMSIDQTQDIKEYLEEQISFGKTSKESIANAMQKFSCSKSMAYKLYLELKAGTDIS